MKVLYSPLDWGIGHASRSIWYIHHLLEEGHEVVLAADGAALALLRTVFPALSFERLPFCRIRYSRFLPAVWKIFFSLPCLMRGVRLGLTPSRVTASAGPSALNMTNPGLLRQTLLSRQPRRGNRQSRPPTAKSLSGERQPQVPDVAN